MSNEDNAVDGTDKTIATMTRDEILALGRNIALADEIGINPQVPWSNVTDQVTWSVDGNAATLNYRQGTLYENINRFSYSSYNPKTVFMLSGLQDGQTTVSAAHKTAAEVLNDVLTVNAETLTDKLYLFRLYPAAAEDNVTVLEYVNGDGQAKTIYANASGEAAVYEPSGIASEVACRSSIDGKTYVGTIPQANLVSGELDSTKLEMYPLNTLKLREVSSVQLYLKDENGTPYANKELTIHAGVYKNGAYCGNARFTLDPNGNATIPVSGEGFTARTDHSGRLSGYTDASQISSYATTAMQWANAEGLITGVTSTTLNPKDSATRAQVATILMRFVENIAA